ncbi:MAG: DoxX family protein [Betaproteobacteria bacterium]|nr:DoxX family protein [Betaproteobacteria bacterium]
MSALDSSPLRNEVLAASRVLIALLFLIFGWEKLTNFSGTLQYMEQVGAPMPYLATLVAIVMEFFVGIAIVLGLYTRPLALLLALYTFGTAVIGHHYWTMTGMARFEGEINFYKNISIIGGLLALYVSGPGRYSIDARLAAARAGARR